MDARVDAGMEQLWSWNSAVPEASPNCVHDLIAERVQAQPNALAIFAHDGELTYKDLDCISEQLARRLTRLIEPETIVPLCFEKSMWTAVAIFAVLKASCAFVLLDVSQPEARLQSIVHQTRATLICSSNKNHALSSRLVGEAEEVIIVGPDLTATSNRETEIVDSLPPSDSSSISYVVFTSGSTGTPKGVAISHSSICTSFYHQLSDLGFRPGVRVFDFASYSFDVAVHNALATLVSGAVLCVPSDLDRIQDPAGAMAAMGVTLANLTPSVARIIDPSRVPSLQTLIFLGEALGRHDAQRWWGKTRIVNTYGPAECTPISTIDYSARNPSDVSDIGIGIGVGTVTWVVDSEDHNVLLRPNCIGELLIEGPLVGWGYLNDQDKSDSVFIRSPRWLHNSRHSRLYKTGDLVQYREDGSLTFIGRKDTQTKIHGQRVELGEVEYHVQHCFEEALQVVVEVVGTKQNTMLVAFLQFADHRTPDFRIFTPNERIVNELSQRLPAYMMPGLFLAIAVIPQTASGKTNRKHLRELGASLSVQRPATQKHQQPTSEMERQLRSIWAEVLEIDNESFGLDASFVSLGGDSLAAIRLVGEARKSNIALRVEDVFKQSTLEAQARLATWSTVNQPIEPFSLVDSTIEIGYLASSLSTHTSLIEDVYPCTPLQEGLLSLTSQISGDYVLQTTIPISELDVEAFKAAWVYAVQATAILRTRIIERTTGLLQVVLRQGITWLYSEDLKEYLRNDKLTPMSLGQPLSRFALVGDGDAKPVWLVLTLHHALYDGWSLNLMADMVNSAYIGHAEIVSAPKFNAFVKYVEDTRTDDATNAYWREALRGNESSTFPMVRTTDRSQATYQEIQKSCNFPRGLNRKAEATPSILVRAALALLISHHTNASDVVFGVTVSGRNAPVPGVERLIGPTIATVPVRVRLDSPKKSVSEYLKMLQDQATEMIPFEQTGLQQISKLGDDQRRACEFQTLLVVQPQDDKAENGELGRWQADAEQTSTYALTLEAFLTQGGVRINASFDSAAIESWRLHRMLEQMELLITQLADASYSNEQIKNLEMLPPRHLNLLRSWNVDVPRTVDRCVPDLFRERVQQLPTFHQAVCSWDGILTYEDLDAHSDTLARHLLMLGVRKELLVPLCFEKSMWTVVVMLAVLKAGGAFVPIDNSWPESRKRHIVQETKAEVIVTSKQYSDLFVDYGCHIVPFDIDFLQALPNSRTRLDVAFDPTILAYIIFTSGTTGTPKGVMLEHRAVSSSCTAHGKAFGFNVESRVLQFSSYTFDACIAEIFTTLIFGGCICIPSDTDRLSNLAGIVNTLGVNWTFLTTSVARMLEPETVPGIKTILFGGEPNTTADYERWMDRQRRVVGVYGPTECCVYCAGHDAADVIGSSLLGKPVSSVGWIVLPDDHNKLAPLGAIGELLIEGPTLARGYLNDEAKTESAFIEDPVWLAQDGSAFERRKIRLYKTGDLVQYTSNGDGTLRYSGRKDTQVKIHGQRTDLSEVEHHVKNSIPEARQVVAEVIPSGDGRYSDVLVAFIQANLFKPNDVSKGDAESFEQRVTTLALPSDVRDLIARQLPGYMIPRAYFSVAEQLPRMISSGKTDRKRLRDLAAILFKQHLAEMETPGDEKRQPSTEAERKLQNLWARVLNISRASSIGLDDNFFQLGGDSITAMKLVAQAGRDKIALTVADVFRTPTLGAQAQSKVETANHRVVQIEPFSLLGQTVDVPALCSDIAMSYGNTIDPFTIEDLYPCTPLQEGLLSLASKRPGDYIQQSVLKLADDIRLDAFKAAWEEIVRVSPVLRTRIVQYRELGLVQMILRQAIQWIEADEDLEEYLKKDKFNPQDLGQPFTRFALVGSNGRPRYFVWTLHHAVYDGWSLSLVADMFNRLYAGRYQPAQQSPFAAFVGYVEERKGKEADLYWQQNLQDNEFNHFPSLPPAIQEPVADIKLERECTLVVKNSTKSSDVTMPTIIRAALAVLISRHTGSTDVVFGTTLSGRNAPVAGLSDIMGPTICTVPIRIQTTAAKRTTVTQFLHEVQLQATEMIPWEQTGLQHIAKISEDTRKACQFQTLLVIQTVDDEILPVSEAGTWKIHEQLGFTTYAITLECFVTDAGVRITAHFDSRVMDVWKMERILGQLNFLIEQFTVGRADQSMMLADVDLLPAEDHAILHRWNKDPPNPSVDKCVHELIREQARARPKEIAVDGWDGELSHAQLDELSDRLGQHLVRFGVGPEVLVPLCFDKSSWTIVAMLGVMKAGGAFVLLDPSHPNERLRMLCERTAATVAVASPSTAKNIDSFVRNVVVIDRGMADWLPQLDPYSSVHASPTDSAYVIFTSGSTGAPKGCKIEHRSYCSAALNHGSVMNMGTDTRALQFGSYSFAGAIMEILMTLIHGGCVCVPSDEERQSMLESAVNRLQANWAFLTSTVLSSLSPEMVPCLRTVCIGGEAIHAAQIPRWSRCLNLRQTYGSAETSAVVSSSFLTEHASTTDVGRATTGRYWLVDPSDIDRLAPLGAAGEVVIEGPTIGREYLGEPEKTAAAFVEAPDWRLLFGTPESGSRFYRTGDIASYTADGAIRLLGRYDFQVKVRGQRIELGEIEHQARSATVDLKEFVVEKAVPKDGDEKAPMLVGFMVVSGTAGEQQHSERLQAALEAVKAKLQSVLPQYMVPSVFLELPELPKTISKKTDRKRLREIASSHSRQELLMLGALDAGDKRQPTTGRERKLQRLWSRVLDIEPENIGLEDSFFEIGGDSISALKLVGEARQNHFTLAMADVFNEPTLAAQAQTGVAAPTVNEIQPFTLLDHKHDDMLQLRRELAAQSSLDPSSIEDAYPCTPLQEGMLSLTFKSTGDYVMQSVLGLSDDIHLEDFQNAWERTASLVATLRTRVIHHDTLGLVQLVIEKAIEWQHSQNEDISDFLTRDKFTPMDLGRPLCRFALVGNKKNKPRWFVWTAHHAIFDGWSLPLVLDMVKATYLGKALPGRKDFTPFIAYLQQADATEAETYWRSELANSDATPFPTLPTPVHKPVADRTIEKSCKLPFNSGRSGATLSTLIRAALGILISRHTNRSDVIFGAVLSGRNAPVTGIENIVGPTIATVPIRACLPGEQLVSEYLRTLQRQTTDMINFEQTGLQNIARIDKSAGEFQTLLVIQPEDQQNADKDETFGLWRLDPEQLGFTTYALTLTCSLSTATEGVHISASFDSSVIGLWKTEKMLEQLCYAMEQLFAAAPSKTISEINLQTPQDLIAVWEMNAIVPHAVERCVHDIVRERTKVQPDAIAISSWDGEMTYNELDILSDRLAAHLSNQVQFMDTTLLNKLIPICFEKSLWTVVAVLAVMKAGGTSVTMDTTQPAERLRTIVQQTDQQLILCSVANESLAAMLLPDRLIVVVGRMQLGRLPLPLKTRQLPSTSPADNICVLFTSGSTGLPKGAAITHSNFATALRHQSAAFEYTPGARIFAFASYSFDISWFDTVHALANGATLCIPSEAERKDDLEGALIRSKATVAFLTPSVARLLDPNAIPSLRCLALGGEPQRWADFSSWPRHVKRLSVYGPAECTVVSSAQDAHILKKRDMTLPANIGLNTWLVDPSNDKLLSPPGSIGEIYLEGALVGAGYIGNSTQTSAVFIEDPPWLLRGTPNHPGRHGRLYRTGDMARYNEDGSMSFAGRRDNQVKIRGQRVELTEIEHQLRRSMSCEAKQVVVEVVNLAREQDGGTLVAFIQTFEEEKTFGDTKEASSATKSEPEAELIRVRADVVDELSRCLPSYMVPRIYFAIRSIPRTVNGKTNRRRLREIGSQFSMQQLATAERSDDQKRQPTNQRESRLQHSWAQILGINPTSIGLDDSFFQLGGDSIAAMKLVGRANKDEFAGLTVADIFRQPTLAEQAQLQLQSQASGGQDEVHPNVPPFSLLDSGVDHSALCERLLAMYNVSGSIEDVYPCTPLQEGLLSLTSKHAGDYVLQNVLELADTEDFQIEAFQAAWEVTVQSTATLRTRIVQHDSFGLMQMVLKGQVIDWHWALDQELEEYLRVDKLTSMDFGQALTRFAFVGQRSGRRPRWFVWTIHHTLYDGWSLPLMTSRAFSSYLRLFSAPSVDDPKAGHLRSEELNLATSTENRSLDEKYPPRKSVQQQASTPDFKAFVQYVERGKSAQANSYWMSALAQNQSVAFPPMPPSASRPIANGILEHECKLSAREMRTSDLTMSTLVRGALAIVISRSTNVPEATFGATVSGRNAPVPGIEEMAGPTIASVPVRVKVPGEITILAYLNGLQHQATEMIQYEQTGLQNIAKLSEDAQSACELQTLLVVQPMEDPLPAEQLFGTWQTDSEQLGFTTYALTIQCFLKTEGVRFRASFDTRVIDSWRMGRLLSQLSFLTVQLSTARPTSPIGEIESLPPEDKETIWKWNSTVPPVVERCVNELMEDIVRERPNNAAVRAWDGDLTYLELGSFSHQLALSLVEFGVTPGMIVPLCFEKSMWTAVAVFAVLKAGAAFVLLDADTQPEARLTTIVQQAKAKLICSSLQRESLSQRLLGRVVLVGPNSIKPPRVGATLPPPVPSNPLYLIFTSGSTGEPKGAILPHTSFASALCYQRSSLNFTNQTRTYDFASYSFDVAVHNMLSTLASGGCLCVPFESDRKSRTAESMESLGANAISLTASVARLIDPDQVPTLDTLTFLGEPVSEDDAKRWWGKVRIITSYGPAECTPTSTVNSFASSPAAVRSLGVGVGVCTWIVDPEDHEVLLPLSQVGELVLEGPLLGNGYLNDREKTAAAFIEDPTWLIAGSVGQPGRRGHLYKTGDLVQYNPDGTLQIIGRKDSQIKVRGQRLELEDVEHHLRECLPAATIAAEAIQPTETTAAPVLAAFICLMPPERNGRSTQTAGVIDESAMMQIAPKVALLDDQMSKRLPAYMVPTVYVPVTEIPMTATGKTNRRSLRKLGASLTEKQVEQMRGRDANPGEPVRTEQERRLQALWAQVLDIPIEKISRDDSFFKLGGNSIDAMKVVGQARRLGVNFTVADMFQQPSIAEATRNLELDGECIETVDELATPSPFSLIEPSIREGAISSLLSHTPDVRPENVNDILPTTDFQAQSIARGIELPPAALNYFWLDLGTNLDVQLLRDSCKALVSHYSALRSVFVPYSNRHWQVILKECDVHFSTVTVSEDLQPTCESICLNDSYEGLSTGRLPTAFVLVRNQSQRHRLIIRLSHAQYDGLCLPLMLQTLADLCHGRQIGPEATFSTYLAHQLKQRPSSSVYWKSLLAGSKISQIPLQISRDTNSIAPIEKIQAEYTISLPQPANGTSVASIVASSWAVLCSLIMGQEDVVFGHVVSGRDAVTPGVHDIAGPCVNIIPVRAKLNSEQTSADVVGAIQKQFLSLGQAGFMMGWEDILESCTDWPTGAKLDSIVQHQNINEHPEFEIAGTQARLDWYDNPDAVYPHLNVASYPEAGQLRVKIMANNRIMAFDTAVALVTCLCDTIGIMASVTDKPILAVIPERVRKVVRLFRHL